MQYLRFSNQEVAKLERESICAICKGSNEKQLALLVAVRASYVLEMNDWPSVFLFDGCYIQLVDNDVWQLFAKTDRLDLFMGNHT